MTKPVGKKQPSEQTIVRAVQDKIAKEKKPAKFVENYCDKQPKSEAGNNQLKQK